MPATIASVASTMSTKSKSSGTLAVVPLVVASAAIAGYARVKAAQRPVETGALQQEQYQQHAAEELHHHIAYPWKGTRICRRGHVHANRRLGARQADPQYSPIRRDHETTREREMLAPRRTLHSTPTRVFRTALALVNATAEDVLYDIGCGDGRCVVAAASLVGMRTVGIEIDHERVAQAKAAAEAAGVDHLVTIRQGNALECECDDATVIFLFLIERGLKLIRPKLEQRTSPCRVVTYLYKFPGLAYQSRHFVQAKESSEDAAFPIYIYEFPSTATAAAPSVCPFTTPPPQASPQAI